MLKSIRGTEGTAVVPSITPPPGVLLGCSSHPCLTLSRRSLVVRSLTVAFRPLKMPEIRFHPMYSTRVQVSVSTNSA